MTTKRFDTGFDQPAPEYIGLTFDEAAALGRRRSEVVIRIAKQLDQSREALLAKDEGNHFVPASSVSRLELRKRWDGHSLVIVSHDVREGREYEWKPALNTFATVNELLDSVFGLRLVRT